MKFHEATPTPFPVEIVNAGSSDNTGTVIVAGIGILGTLLAPIITNWLSSKRDDLKWRREQRLSTYVEFVETSIQFRMELGAIEQKRREGYDQQTALLTADKLFHKLANLTTRISVVGSQKVHSITKQFISEALDATMAIWDDPKTWLLERLDATDAQATKYIREDLGTKEADEKRQQVRARREYLQLSPIKYALFQVKQWMLKNWEWYSKREGARVQRDIAAGKYDKPEQGAQDQ